VSAYCHYFLGSKEDDITKSNPEAAALSDSGSVLRQAVNGWRKPQGENPPKDAPRNDDLVKSSSTSESPLKDGQATGRDLQQEVLLSPGGTNATIDAVVLNFYGQRN